MRAGVIGIGDMGSGLAKNLIQKGFPTIGIDLLDHRMKAFIEMGGVAANSPADVGQEADAVFIMVMNGREVNEVVLGEHGLVSTLRKGAAIILTATINPAEVQALGEALVGTGIHLIDSPVSGGYPGAQNGALTLMASASKDVFRVKDRRLKLACSR